MMMPDNVREDMYNELFQERTIILNEPIDEDVIERIVIPIMLWNADDDEHAAVITNFERKPIEIYINSVGGAAHETLSVISAIESSETPVFTYALGKANSGGFFILMSGHKRFAQRYSTLLFHQVQSRPPEGPTQQLDEFLSESKRLQSVFDELTTTHTEIPKRRIEDVLVKKLDWCMTAEEALEYGVIDEII